MRVKRTLEEFTADKRKLQQRTSTMKRSWDEVAKILELKSKKKSNDD